MDNPTRFDDDAPATRHAPWVESVLALFRTITDEPQPDYETEDDWSRDREKYYRPYLIREPHRGFYH